MSLYSTVYIGLGSNLENPEAQINSALSALQTLPNSQGLQCSHWYRSKAIGPGEQPDYINAAASLETQLSPFELLHQLQRIENDHGRQRNIRWGARTLDLDLLLYGNICIDTEELHIPHPEMTNRNFVLYPLQDISPALIFPNGQSLSTVIENVSMSGIQRTTNHNEDTYCE